MLTGNTLRRFDLNQESATFTVQTAFLSSVQLKIYIYFLINIYSGKFILKNHYFLYFKIKKNMKPLQKENGYFVSMECWCEKCYNEKHNLEWGEN